MIIQGRSIPFDVNDKVPMGVKIPTQGSYKIAIATVDGLFLDSAQKIYIEDKELNIIHDLTVSPYSFTAQSGEYNNRFDLRYTNALLSNESFITENSVTIFNNAGNIKTVSSIEKIKNIEVYNVLGQRLASKTNIDANEVEINTVLSTNQALIVKVSLNNNQVITKKILF